MIIRWVCPQCERTVDDIPAEKPSCIKCHVLMRRYKIEEGKPICLMTNCNRVTKLEEAMCSKHR